jgi:hypothetical protein
MACAVLPITPAIITSGLSDQLLAVSAASSSTGRYSPASRI